MSDVQTETTMRGRPRPDRRLTAAVAVLALMATNVLVWSVGTTPVAAAPITTGNDNDLEWVGGYHEPFDYDSFYEFGMNSCGPGSAARSFNGSVPEPYVNESYHLAYDMNASGDANDPVYAIADGTIVDTPPTSWPGNALWIRHDRGDGTTFTAVYGHIDVNVSDADPGRSGRQVRRGQRIGSIHSYGSSHLHFGINTGSTTASGVYPCSSWPAGRATPNLHGWVDPISWLSANPLANTTSRAGIEADGHLFLAAIGRDGNLHYRARSSAKNSWHSWNNKGNPGVKLQGTPSLAESGGHLFMAAIGTDGKLYTRARTASTNKWHDWRDRGNPGVELQGSPSIIEADGYLFLAAIGRDGDLYYRVRNASNGRWADWRDKGGPTADLQGSPSIVEADGYLFMAAIGADGHLHYRVRNSTTNEWHSWNDKGAPIKARLQGTPSTIRLTGSPDLAVVDGYLFIAGIGADGRLYYRARNSTTNSWFNWNDKGSPSSKLQGSPSLVVSDGYLFMSAIGTDGRLYYRARNSTTDAWFNWSDKGSPGVKLTGSPSLVVADGYLFTASIGSDGALYYRARAESNDRWHSWNPKGKPKATSLVSYRNAS